jgi:hypothetical protein
MTQKKKLVADYSKPPYWTARSECNERFEVESCEAKWTKSM